MAACTNAAKDGLILDGKEAALVPFGKVVQYIPMVAGLLKKARNSGDISSIAAHVVYEQDDFTYVLGDDEHIHHAPKFGNRGKLIAVYAIARLKDGSVQREVMDSDAVMAIAEQSKNKAQYNPKTGKNYGEWWRKTVIRRISKYLPSSSDKDGFAQAVGRIDDDFDFQNDNAPAHSEQHQPKKRGAGAAAFNSVKTEEPHDPETGEVIDAEYQEVPDDQADSNADCAPSAGDDI